MRVMVIIKATTDSEAGVMPSEQLLTEMGRYNEELVKAGIMLDGAGLHPSSKAVRVRFSGTNRTVTDGPFVETKELIAGFWIWRVKSMQDAIEWVKKCPNPMLEDSDIDIRPIFEAEDFGEVFTPELREQEAGVLAMTKGLNQPRFEQGPALKLVGLSRTYDMQTRTQIADHWHEFVPQVERIPHQVGEMHYGVSYNTQPDCRFDYLTGVEVSQSGKLPAGFISLELSARRYAVFPHTGHVSTLDKTIDAIWTHWAPDCGLKIASAPCYERYSTEFNPDTGLGGMEIWVPLEA